MKTCSACESFQRSFTGYLRNVDLPPPEGLALPRLNLYRDLVFNNMSSLLKGGFPVVHSLLTPHQWSSLVSDFLANYRCRTPYFLEIGQEFVSFLASPHASTKLPQYLPQLAHYERVELALDIDETELADLPVDPAGDLWRDIPVVSPLACSLVYDYPVQKIGVDWQPSAPDGPHCIVVYRDRSERVRFMGINPATARFIELLAAGEMSGQEATLQLSVELGYATSAPIQSFAQSLLERLLAHDILLGSVPITQTL